MDVWSEPEESEIITLVSHIALISLHKRNSYSSIQFELLSSSMYDDDQDSELETGPIEKLMKEVCDFSSVPVESIEKALNKLIVKLEKSAKEVQEETFEHTSMALSHLVTLTNPKAIPSLNQSLEVYWKIFERVFKVLQNRIRTLVNAEKTKTGRTLVLHLLKSCRKLLQNNNFDIFLGDDKLHEERKPVLSEFLELIQNGLIIANNSGKKVFRKKVQLYASKLIRCFMTFCSAKYIDEFAPKKIEQHPCFIINNPLIEAITERALWFEVHAEYIHLMSEHYGDSTDEKLKDVMECVVTVCTQFISKVKDNAKNVLKGHSLGGGRNRRPKRDYDDYDDEEEEDYRQIKFTKKEVSRAFNALTISLPNVGKDLFTTHYQDICQTAFFFMEKSLLTVGVDSICLLSGLIKAMKRYDRELLKKEIHTFVTKVFPLIKGNYKEDEITMMENKEEEDGDFETEIALTSIDFYHTIFVDSEIREILLAKSPNFVHSLYTNLCNFVNKECSYELESLERVEQSKLSLRVLEAMVYSTNPEVTKLVKPSDIKGFVITHLDGIIRSFKTDKDYHKIAKYLRALNLFFRVPENEKQVNKCATLLIEYFNTPQTSSNSSGGNKKQKKKSPTPSTSGNASAQQQQIGKQFKDCCQYIDNLKKTPKTFDEETPLFVRQELSAQSQELIQKLKHWKLIQ